MVAKSFRDYIQENEREYHMRIKSVAPLDENEMPYIERVLDKYVVKDMTQPKKTILQKHPLDFPDIQNAEVWIIDVTTALPVSSYVLQQELKLALNLPEKYLVVRGDNEPLEVYTQQMNANDEIDLKAMEDELSPASRLSTKSHYDEDEQINLEDDSLYGNEYNSRFLETLAKVKAERKKFVVDRDGYDPDSVLDSDDPGDPNAFNDHINDAPESKHVNEYAEILKNLRKQEQTKNEARLSSSGNYDDDEIKKSKKFHKYGESDKISVVTITNEKEGIRKK